MSYIERSYATPETESRHREEYPDHWERYEFAGLYAGGQRILDVACSCGYGSAFLTRKSSIQTTGLDRDKDAIAWAERHYGKDGRFIHTDGVPWQLESNSFSMVVSLETLEHVQSPSEFLKEIARVLEPNGILILSTPCNETTSRFSPDNPFHLREYSWEELAELLSSWFVIESRWSQVSNLSEGWQKLRDSKLGPLVKGLKACLPRKLVTMARQTVASTNSAKSGKIAPGRHAAANVQLVIARKMS